MPSLREVQQELEQNCEETTSVRHNLQKLWADQSFPEEEVETTLDFAIDVLDTEENAIGWLSTPNPALEDKSPFSWLGQPGGMERVTNLLGRIKYGILA